MKVWQVLLIILVILIAVLVALYFLGKRAQKKQDENQAQIEAAKQTVNMLIIEVSLLVIDKKKMKLKDAGFPQIIVDNTPKYLRRSKVPVVKAKIGPRIMTMVADEKIFDLIPLKKEVKATISGIYITDVRGVRGPLEQPKPKEKFFQRMKNKIAKKDK